MKLDRGMSSAHHVYQELYLRIIECSMKPGETIFKQKIADEFKLSQGPVRDAILRLQSEDLVEVVPQSKTSVTLIDLQNAHDSIAF